MERHRLCVFAPGDDVLYGALQEVWQVRFAAQRDSTPDLRFHTTICAKWPSGGGRENSDIGSVAGPTKPEPDERIDALYRSLRGLDPFNRALMMLYLDDRSYLEIADVLGISETNVATKISRLKQRLRSELAPSAR